MHTEPTKEEQAAATRLIQSIIREAHYRAHLTAAFLKAQGYPSDKKDRCSSTKEELDPALRQRANHLLLNLGALLKIAEWEVGGLRVYLPANIPSSTSASKNLVPPSDSSGDAASPTAPSLYFNVGRTWLEQFSHESQGSIGADVVWLTEDIEKDEALEALADFLWAHRHQIKHEKE